LSASFAWFQRLSWPIVLGHRGSRTVAPENTLAAIAIAADARADGVEVDVRPCASGELIVIHDPTLERITGGRDQRAVSALTLDELDEVKLEGGESIPTLEEVLDYCAERSICVNVELKRDVPSRKKAIAATARLLRSYDEDLMVIVSSFDPAMLMGVRMLVQKLPIALLIEKRSASSPMGIVSRHLGAVAVHAERREITRERVRRWHELGLRVLAWTVNDAAEARTLLDLGVDGLISDDPAVARAICT